MNVLITGASGFIGKNIKKYLESLDTVSRIFTPSSKELDLTNLHSVRKYFHLRSGQINAIVHCAAVGGRRLNVDDSSCLYNNIVMHSNLIHWFDSEPNTRVFINIGSGAEFDRSKGITNGLPKFLPKDFYGLSKRTITDKLLEVKDNNKRYINLRAFGVFGPGEEKQRFVRSALTRYKNKRSITIHKEKRMDFFYVEDIARIIETILKGYGSKIETIDLSYPDRKLFLGDIAGSINALDEHNVPIRYEFKSMDRDYFGSIYELSKMIAETDLKLVGLNEGIKETYEIIQQELE